MWYSSFSTGIFDIDNQHANIDSLIKLYEKDNEQANEQKWLGMISKTIQLHFDFEENFFNENMPQEHFDEHRKLAEHVKSKLTEKQNNKISKTDLITLMRGLLLNHVIDFDSKFKEIAVREGSHYRYSQSSSHHNIDFGYKFRELN